MKRWSGLVLRALPALNCLRRATYYFFGFIKSTLITYTYGGSEDIMDRANCSPSSLSFPYDCPLLLLQLIQDDGSWAEAAAVALTAGDEVGSGGQEARLEQLLQRTQR